MSVDDRVAAGAAWLDANRPSWWQRINLDTLDLGDDCNCILGQEHGDFTDGLDVVTPDDDGWAKRCADLGLFSAADIRALGPGELDDSVHRGELVDGEYRRLTAAWRTLIQARRNAEDPWAHWADEPEAEVSA
jgi:hypothetical protein